MHLYYGDQLLVEHLFKCENAKQLTYQVSSIKSNLLNSKCNIFVCEDIKEMLLIFNLAGCIY